MREFAVLALLFLLTQPLVGEDAELLKRGEAIYRATCQVCHGENGQGVKETYDQPLHGDSSIGELAKVIAETMPEDDPGKCIGPDAEAVAAYIHHSFYSEAAQIRNRPPRITLTRLTATQLRQSLSDLYSHFEGLPNGKLETGGVRGIYFDGDRWKNENKKIERVDSTIDFDFGRESPGEGISVEAFYINWEGGIKVDVTGTYEIVVRSSCSFKMDLGKLGREFIDNHVQSGDKTEFRQSIALTAGRVYPFKIDFIQRKRKTELPPAKIKLSWIPPGGVEQVIPGRNLVSTSVPATFSVATVLPPDDRSYGFERGISINRQWDESTTAAALEFANIATEELWPAYRKRHRKEEDTDRQQLKSFLTEIAQNAFRQSLSDELRQLYIDKQVSETEDDAEAIKRALLLVLKSPRFLYPTLQENQSRSQTVGNRVALVLYDSLPTDQLNKLIAKNELENEEQIRAYATANITDQRVQAKLRDFFHEWLNLSKLSDITKDPAKFPNFDAALASDLRDSLNAFLDEIAWGQSSDYRQLFTADWTFTNPRMADFYGESWQPADENAKGLSRSVADTERRFGLVSHPYLMSGLSYFDNSSPIHRGVFLIRYLLGRTLRPPEDAFSPLSPDLHPDLTTRERVQLQTNPESCQVCHSKINGLGFTLENFDAVGRYRQQEGEKPIDSSGVYTPREGNDVSFASPAELSQYLASSADAKRAFVSRAFQHFVKQPPAAFGPDTLDYLVRKFEESGYNIRQLIIEITVAAAKK